MSYTGTLIGGPKAGERVVCESNVWRCTELPPLCFSPIPSVSEEQIAEKCKTHIYTHHTLHADGQSVGIFVHEGLSSFEAICLLLRTYERVG